jgi:hypothetical protein
MYSTLKPHLIYAQPLRLGGLLLWPCVFFAFSRHLFALSTQKNHKGHLVSFRTLLLSIAERDVSKVKELS